MTHVAVGLAVADRTRSLDERAERDLAMVEHLAGKPSKGEPPPALAVIDLGNFAEAQPNPPRFVVDRMIPRRVITLLGGHGGSGKTTLALTIAAHVACGRPWAGLDVASGRALFLSLEDEPATVRYRLALIADAYGLDPATLQQRLIVVDGTATDAVLAMEQPIAGARHLIDTPAVRQLAQMAEGVELIVIDNASDAFEANANDPQMVRTFMRRTLGGLARQHDAAVLLLAHIDKAAARHGAAGNSYIGTTAWHNSARSRLALLSTDGALELVHEKANLAARAEPVSLRFTEKGIVMPSDAPFGALDPTAVIEANDGQDVLTALQRAAEAQVNVPTARTGPNTARGVLETFGLPQALCGSRGKARFWRALEKLRQSGCVSSEEYLDTYRHKKQRLKLETGI